MHVGSPETAAGGLSRLLALRNSTRETAWEPPRPLFKPGWFTPMIFRHGAAEDLIVLGPRRLTAYDPVAIRCRAGAGSRAWPLAHVLVSSGRLMHREEPAADGKAKGRRAAHAFSTS